MDLKENKAMVLFCSIQYTLHRILLKHHCWTIRYCPGWENGDVITKWLPCQIFADGIFQFSLNSQVSTKLRNI